MAFGDSKLKAQQRAAEQEANKITRDADDINDDLENNEQSKTVNNTAPAPTERLSFRQKWDAKGAVKPQTNNQPQTNTENIQPESMKADIPDVPANISEGRGRAEAFRQRQKQEEERKNGSFNQRNQSSYSQDAASIAQEAKREEGMKDYAGSLDPKLVVIIEKVCTFLNKSKKEVDEIMDKAIKNPEAVKSEYNTMYNDIVQPKTQERYRSIEDAQTRNPDRIVFMSVKDGEDKLIGLVKEKFPAFEIYQGTIMQTVDFDRTPFDAPSKLFNNEIKQEVKQEVVNDTKQENTSQPSVSRPKP